MRLMKTKVDLRLVLMSVFALVAVFAPAASTLVEDIGELEGLVLSGVSILAIGLTY